MERKLTLAQAQARYPHRYTLDHVPAWATKPHESKYYAPQYRSDAEWYARTRFPGEEGHIGGRGHCFSTGQTWPLGKWLPRPYRRGD